MSFLALLMGAVITGSTVIKYGNQPLDMGLVEQSSTPHIRHLGYSPDNERQLMIQKAYDLGGLPFVIMIECESGFNPRANGDSGRAYGLCQLNNRWHNVSDEYKNSWEVQIDTCYQKWIGGTKFYGPTRKINGQLCKDYVLDRFIVE